MTTSANDPAPVARTPAFDAPLASGGYLWWYLDVLSDDQRHGLVLIVLLGNPFSPFYSRAHATGVADPLEHCAVNAVLYRRGGKLWTFTEHGRAAVERSADALQVGSGQLCRDGEALVARFDQRSPLVGRRLAGAVRLHAGARFDQAVVLDGSRAEHHWHPIAPHARAEVILQHPDLRFSGHAYHDVNSGAAPLSAGFDRWSWSRVRLPHATAVLYDTSCTGGLPQQQRGWLYDDAGTRTPVEGLCAARLPRTRWSLPRATRVDAGATARLLRTFESAPFYARSLLQVRMAGQTAIAMHETIDLRRFRRRWIQRLFYLRMRREVSWSRRAPLGLIARWWP